MTVVKAYPTADGTPAQWTFEGSGVYAFTKVDGKLGKEYWDDSDAPSGDGLVANTVNDEQWFGFSSNGLTRRCKISSIAVHCRVIGAGNGTVVIGLDDGTVSWGSTEQMYGSKAVSEFSESWASPPSGGTWLPEHIKALGAGIKFSSGAAPTLRRIWIEVAVSVFRRGVSHGEGMF